MKTYFVTAAALGLIAMHSYGQLAEPKQVVVLHAARLLDVTTGTMTAPGEILVRGDRIVEVGTKVARPDGAEVIDLGTCPPLPPSRC
jgi:imidazolonepropionase-like amidohydrolase